MKSTLTFSLPEETQEFEWAYKGHIYHRIIVEVAEALRQKIKYEEREDSKTLEEIRQELWEIVRDNGVSEDFA